MNSNAIEGYAKDLGCQYRLDEDDNGTLMTITKPGYTRFSYFAYWGDDEAQRRAAVRWLHDLPWPAEDDPRVQNEGTYA